MIDFDHWSSETFDFRNLTLAGKMNKKLVTLISLKMAERGEAKNREEEFRVKKRNFDIWLESAKRSFASKYLKF